MVEAILKLVRLQDHKKESDMLRRSGQSHVLKKVCARGTGLFDLAIKGD